MLYSKAQLKKAINYNSDKLFIMDAFISNGKWSIERAHLAFTFDDEILKDTTLLAICIGIKKNIRVVDGSNSNLNDTMTRLAEKPRCNELLRTNLLFETDEKIKARVFMDQEKTQYVLIDDFYVDVFDIAVVYSTNRDKSAHMDILHTSQHLHIMGMLPDYDIDDTISSLMFKHKHKVSTETTNVVSLKRRPGRFTMGKNQIAK